MEDIIKNYLLSHSIEEITNDWNNVHSENNTKLDKWFDLLKTLEKNGDIVASELYSNALRCLVNIANTSESTDHDVLYSDENFEKIKAHVIESLKYDCKHSRGADREMYKEAINNLGKYNLN